MSAAKQAFVQFPDGSIWTVDGMRCVISAFAEAKCGRSGDDYYACSTATVSSTLRVQPEVLSILNSHGDLLAVLIECRKQITAIIDDGVPTDWQSWLDDLNAAISKAEGRP